MNVTEMNTPALVREFAAIKVWFVVHETTGPTSEGGNRHHRLGEVVDELRARGVLD
jgi:hypothetical protein